MKRLTKRNIHGIPYYPECFDKCAGEGPNIKCHCCYFEHEIIIKLAEYEDLEEQGLLVKLPFKVGDTIFVVGTKCLADKEPDGQWCAEQDCDECIYDKEYIVFETKVVSYMLYMIVAEEDQNWIFGKTVFLTKEEAEKALAEMGE